jgi:hypothetical protein
MAQKLPVEPLQFLIAGYQAGEVAAAGNLGFQAGGKKLQCTA